MGANWPHTPFFSISLLLLKKMMYLFHGLFDVAQTSPRHSFVILASALSLRF
jgi:hypothetical protein